MSYILDALRRADADRERERGAVPGLHTQALPDALADASPLPGLRRWMWPAAALVAVLLAAAAGWAWFAPSAPVDVVAPVTMAPPSPLPAPVAEPSAAEPAPAPPAEPQAPVRPAAPVARAAQRPVAVEATRPAAKPVASRASAATATSAAATSPGASAGGAAPTRVASLAELPEEARRGLPALAFGGSIYASTPANRLLIVNGQLMHEGDSLGGGVTLEQIKPRAAVIVIRGQRYEVGY